MHSDEQGSRGNSRGALRQGGTTRIISHLDPLRGDNSDSPRPYQVRKGHCPGRLVDLHVTATLSLYEEEGTCRMTPE